MIPCGFILGVVTPLYFTHLDDLTVSHSLCGMQNLDRPLTVGQALLLVVVLLVLIDTS
jgi:hypothetical protein